MRHRDSQHTRMHTTVNTAELFNAIIRYAICVCRRLPIQLTSIKLQLTPTHTHTHLPLVRRVASSFDLRRSFVRSWVLGGSL